MDHLLLTVIPSLAVFLTDSKFPQLAWSLLRSLISSLIRILPLISCSNSLFPRIFGTILNALARMDISVTFLCQGSGKVYVFVYLYRSVRVSTMIQIDLWSNRSLRVK